MALQQAVEKFQADASEIPGMTGPVSSYQSNLPQLEVKIDRVKAQAHRVELSAILDTLQTFRGSVYINDFTMFGRVYRVVAQAVAELQTPSDITQLHVKNAKGERVPWGAFVTISSTFGPSHALQRLSGGGHYR